MSQPALWRRRLATRLQTSWVQRDWLAYVLYDVSLLYRALVALRSWLYKKHIFESEQVRVPVIVVGNVVAGGAGKTPVVIEIVRHLQARGWHVGVVSRGYGRKEASGGGKGAPGNVLEVTASTPTALSGDEPALIHLATRAPMFVGRDRVRTAQALLAAHPKVNVIVSDDGLQHLALQRDIEICVFDERGLGHGWLLPAGPLREPWPRHPNNIVIDFLLHTTTTVPGGMPPQGTSAHRITRQLGSHALHSDGSRIALADLQEQPLHAVAAIAQPEIFFNMLHEQGLALGHVTALPDHYSFDSWLSNEFSDLPLICTEKDAVKLWAKHPKALAVPLMVEIPPAFFTALQKKLSSLAAQRSAQPKP